MAGRASDRKNKMAGNAGYCCDNPKSGIKLPATPYIIGNKVRKVREIN